MRRAWRSFIREMCLHVRWMGGPSGALNVDVGNRIERIIVAMLGGV